MCPLLLSRQRPSHNVLMCCQFPELLCLTVSLNSHFGAKPSDVASLVTVSCHSFLSLKNLASSPCNTGDTLAMTCVLVSRIPNATSHVTSANNKLELSSPGGILTLQKWLLLQTWYCSPEGPLDPGRQLPGISCLKMVCVRQFTTQTCKSAVSKESYTRKGKLLHLVVILMCLPYSPWSIVCM